MSNAQIFPYELRRAAMKRNPPMLLDRDSEGNVRRRIWAASAEGFIDFSEGASFALLSKGLSIHGTLRDARPVVHQARAIASLTNDVNAATLAAVAIRRLGRD